MELELEPLLHLPTMLGIAVVMALFWTVTLEISKKALYDWLPSTDWWERAIRPTTMMMQNFGYPSEPTDKFPDAVTEPMARDFYAFLTTLCIQHFLSALPMAPVVLYGWNEVSELWRVAFLLGTLSDLGFDLYDAIKSSMRTFFPHSAPLPLDFWIVVVAMHHTLALTLLIPMNLKYIHLAAFQQTVMSLLFAASICYLAGNYKFTLDIRSKSGFYQYKVIVIIQLVTIIYTRVYLWYPAMYSILSHLKEQDDSVFYYGGCFMGLVFSLFNTLLLVDAVGAAAKWLPKSLPKTEKDVNVLRMSMSDGHGAAPVSAFTIVAKLTRRRRFKGAVHSVIALNRMKLNSSGAVQASSSSGADNNNSKKAD